MLNVVVINVGNSGCDLTSWESSSEFEDLGTNVSVEFTSICSTGHQQVVKVISSSDNLNIVKVVRVDSWKADTAVVHLSCEDFITKEVVSKDTTVRVGMIVRVCPSHIWKITDQRVHRVVLLMNIVKVTGVIINSIGSKDVFEQ